MDELIFKTETFEGPLEHLENLIKKNKLDICKVSLIEITGQYIEHINRMEEMNLEVSADFLLVLLIIGMPISSVSFLWC